MYEAYLHGSENVDPSCKQTNDSSLACFDHYRSSILDSWTNIDEVAFVAMRSGTVIKYAIFNGAGSDSMNWFSAQRLKNSSWNDLKTLPSHQFFSIIGDDSGFRRFFINHEYGGCRHDVGWFVAMDQPSPACEWEKNEGYPVFMYSDSDTFENWTTGKTARADVIAVYVKYREVEKLDFVDLFETGQKEWRLVFRGTSHISQPIYNAYLHGEENVDAACKQTNGDIPCQSHYRSTILDYWEDEAIGEVALAVFKSGQMMKYLVFDGMNTNHMDWFTELKLKSSSWTDIKGNVQFFSIPGDGGNSRRFFINHRYANCPRDQGWLVASEHQNHPCGWESVKTYPLFLYSNSSHFENWSHGQVAEADVIAVFVKFNTQGVVIG